MREIKFRAWDKVNNRWLEIDDFSHYICYADKGCDKGGICGVWFGGTREDENIIWLQYTGLKDKNGEEVYEGDIIKVILTNGLVEIFQLLWDKDRARFNLVDKQTDWWSFTKDNDMEIIGNIYENPELLER